MQQISADIIQILVHIDWKYVSGVGRNGCPTISCLLWKSGYKSLSDKCSRRFGSNLGYETGYSDRKFVHSFLTSLDSTVISQQAYITKSTSSNNSTENRKLLRPM
jgi:hypothetical protein